MEISSKKEQDLDYTIDCLQIYLTELLKKNINNSTLSRRIKNDAEKIHNASNMLKSSVKEQTVADEIGYLLTQKS